MGKRKLEFVIDDEKYWDKRIEINSSNLRIFVAFDDRTVAQDKLIRRDLKKMVDILNKHWND